MANREGALARAASFFDGGGFKALLSDLVAIPFTAQEEGREADLDRYLNGAIRPWLERLGFTVQVRPNPREGFGPILTAARIEDPARPTVLLYGYRQEVSDHCMALTHERFLVSYAGRPSRPSSDQLFSIFLSGPASRFQH